MVQGTTFERENKRKPKDPRFAPGLGNLQKSPLLTLGHFKAGPSDFQSKVLSKSYSSLFLGATESIPSFSGPICSATLVSRTNMMDSLSQTKRSDLPLSAFI